MKNFRKNYCVEISGSELFRCNANPHYTCKYFSKDIIYMSECTFNAMGKCINHIAQNHAKKGDEK